MADFEIAAGPLEEFASNRRLLTVEWGHCDPAGIVYHPRFIDYFDWSCVVLIETALGMKKSAISKVYGMAGIPVVGLSARVTGVVRYGDEIEIVSTITALNRSSFHVRHTLTRDGLPMADCTQMRVWCEHDPKAPTSLKSCEIPAEVREKLRRRAVPSQEAG
ncbi:MAG: acyl-CoA thioesterase [Xanthobacteraceae bacterium]|nr:MAG: acyl-CoA thioesterase [Xanthobacteraceae bacterium]